MEEFSPARLLLVLLLSLNQILAPIYLSLQRVLLMDIVFIWLLILYVGKKTRKLQLRPFFTKRLLCLVTPVELNT